MWEFLFGIVYGAVATHFISRIKPRKKDAMIQVDEPVLMSSEPILIPNKKNVFVAGSLSNLWGKDS